VSISGSSITSDYNAWYGGSWGYGSEGSHTIHLTAGQKAGVVTNAAGGDFTLPAGSAVIDKGTPIAGFSADIIGTSRPQGAGWDIGAYERPYTPPNPKGDLNWDGAVNNQDINAFVLALTDEAAYLAQYNKTHAQLLEVGDIGGAGGQSVPDGAFNNQDINGFVAILTGG
jgi:hypothetical protein